MAKILRYLSIVFSLSVISVRCKNLKFSHEYDPIKFDVVSTKNFSISNIIDGILFGDWMENIPCMVELNAIKNGLAHREEWAYKSILYPFYIYFLYLFASSQRLSYIFLFLALDSWGRLPSGILSGNSFDPGSFSQCFRIKRDYGVEYKTQYCIGTLKFQPRKSFRRNKVWTR